LKKAAVIRCIGASADAANGFTGFYAGSRLGIGISLAIIPPRRNSRLFQQNRPLADILLTPWRGLLSQFERNARRETCRPMARLLQEEALNQLPLPLLRKISMGS
jgi:hypothetical protein